VSAKIIPIGIQHAREWPPGALGTQLERTAQLLAQRAREAGQHIPAERFRRSLLRSLRPGA